jgi:hypothetical protein
MMRLRFLILPLVVTLATLVNANPDPAQSPASSETPQAAPTPAAGATVVYVSDFDLDVVANRGRRVPSASKRSGSGTAANSSSAAGKGDAANSAPAKPASAASDASKEETPADQAKALINAVSENLIRALQQAGYDARRLPVGAPLPDAGLRIRGVFAEADEQNRARRLLVGGVPVSPTMILYVGVNNLARPDQPLYELAYPPVKDPRHGPVITVTSYVPAARFELSRDPSGEELRKISKQIAADFTALLNANPLSAQ